ncbi:MAG: response regulator [Planctomycetota bacterium]|nr:response regulator [Planctomycetota bacterium]
MKLYIVLIAAIGLGGWIGYELYCEKCAYKSWQDVSHFLVSGDPENDPAFVDLERLSEQCSSHLSRQITYIQARHAEIESETIASTREYQLKRLTERIDQFRGEIECTSDRCMAPAGDRGMMDRDCDCESRSAITFMQLNTITKVVQSVVDSSRSSSLVGLISPSLDAANAMDLQTHRQSMDQSGSDYSNKLLVFKESLMREQDPAAVWTQTTLDDALGSADDLEQVAQSGVAFSSALNTLATTVSNVTQASTSRARDRVLWYSIAFVLVGAGFIFIIIGYVRSLILITNETSNAQGRSVAIRRFTSLFPALNRLGGAVKNLSDGKERIAGKLRQSEQQYRNLEKQKELEKQLAGVVAHEYGNKLMVMEGNLLLMKTKLESPEILPLLNSALTACQQAKMITDGFRSSAGRQVHQKPISIALNDLIAQQVDEMKPILSRSKQVVELDLDPRLKSIVAAKEDLDGILLNLILNAMEANEVVGGKRVTIRTLSVEKIDHSEIPEGLASKIVSGIQYASFEVIDEGVGITAELGEQVYTLGVTTKSGLRTEHVGERFGKGLHIVWDSVTANNGAVDFVRNESNGVTFRVFLPAGSEVVEAQPRAYVIPSVEREHGKVLLIEDDEDVREVTCAVLEASGWDVDSVSSAEEALEWYEDDFRLLISDIRLGPARLDGHQLVEEIRSRGSLIPFLLISGYTQKEVMECVDPHEGIVRFLKKPFTPEELDAAIWEVVALDEHWGGDEDKCGALLV